MLKTEKDYSDPFVRQLSLFLDNRVGKLREVLRHLTSEDIFVHALSVVDSADHAIVRLVVDRVETSHKVLLEKGVPTSINQILAVEVPNERAGIRMICRSLIQAEINIHYAYPMLTRPHGFGVLIMHVDENDTALDLLKRDGFNCLDESDMGLAGI
ncbi:MAG: hypothetical protein DSY81_00525 [Bacillota bacterium]|nr:MAG: hypothetical protein DSY92_06385 [Planctomycetota bacterium]RUA11490.1 MAG: hypothetical protein DSY81_00525 [Bacillota bacterium]